MPWQHQLVLAEIFLSFLLVIPIFLRGVYRRDPGTTLFWLAWDAVFFWLFVSGLGSAGWGVAATLYTGIMALNTVLRVKKTVTTPVEVFPAAQRGANLVSAAVLSAMMGSFVLLST